MVGTTAGAVGVATYLLGKSGASPGDLLNAEKLKGDLHKVGRLLVQLPSPSETALVDPRCERTEFERALDAGAAGFLGGLIPALIKGKIGMASAIGAAVGTGIGWLLSTRTVNDVQANARAATVPDLVESKS